MTSDNVLIKNWNILSSITSSNSFTYTYGDKNQIVREMAKDSLELHFV